MTWRWWKWRRRHNGQAAVAKAESEAKLKAAERADPMIDLLARKVAELPEDEFVNRVARAFRARSS